MNLKYTALILLLLNSAFSFSVVNSKAPQQAQTQQVTLSPEEQEAFNQIFEQIISFIVEYMVKNKLTIAICDNLVCEIKNDQIFINDASTLTAVQIARIPNITNAIFEEITAAINAMPVN